MELEEHTASQAMNYLYSSKSIYCLSPVLVILENISLRSRWS